MRYWRRQMIGIQLLLLVFVALQLGCGEEEQRCEPTPTIDKVIPENSVDCGHFEGVQSSEGVATARSQGFECGLSAWTDDKPFFFKVSRVGIDSTVYNVFIGNPSDQQIVMLHVDSFGYTTKIVRSECLEIIFDGEHLSCSEFGQETTVCDGAS